MPSWKTKNILLVFTALSLVSVMTAFAAKNFNVMNSAQSFFFVNSTSSNVGIGTTTPQGGIVINNGNMGIGTWTAAGGNLIVAGNGNVGIGSAWPGVTLDVNGTMRDMGEYLSSNAPSNTSNALYNNSGTLYFNGSAVAGGLWSTTSYGIGEYGNVGVGTTTPQGGFVVVNGNVGIGTWVPKGTLDVEGANSTAFFNGNVGVGTGTPQGSFVVTRGNMGIGTWSPATTLDVDGSILISRLTALWYPAKDNTPNGSIAIGASSLAAEGGLASHAYVNTVIGYQAMASSTMTTNTTNSVAVGYQALQGTGVGQNVAFGYQSQNNNPGNNGGNGLFSFGAYTMQSDTENGSSVGADTVFGFQAGMNLNGGGNVAVGCAALIGVNNPSEGGNTAIGCYTGGLGGGNGGNTLIGSLSGGSIQGTVADYNVALGFQSAYDLTTGTENNILGYYPSTGVGVTSGSNNILIGYDVRPPSQTAGNQLNVGNLIYANGLSTAATASTGNVGIGTTTPLTRLTVLNGNVGIGTWTSHTALDVEGIVSFDNVVRGNVGIGTATPQASFVVTNGNVGIGTWAANGGKLIVNGVGNVGIGSAWPGVTLDVKGTMRDLGEYLSGNVPSPTTNALYNNNGTLYFNGSSEGGLWSTTGYGIGEYGNVGVGTTTPQGGFVVVNGNVGIGTWVPKGTLDVEGANSTAFFNGNVGVGTSTPQGSFVVTGGNMGIGTWSPAATLDVDGSILISRLTALWYPAKDNTPNGSIAIGASSLTTEGGLASHAYNNTVVGYQAMSSSSMKTSSLQSTAVGYQALMGCGVGSNDAFGYMSLTNNGTGAGAEQASAFGAFAMMSDKEGDAAFGFQAGINQNHGDDTAVGCAALGGVTTGGTNTGVGCYTGGSNGGATTASQNTFIGSFSGATILSGAQSNVAMGYRSGYDLTTGLGNIFLGYYTSTGVGETSGNDTILIGYDVRPLSQTAGTQMNIGNLIYANGLTDTTTASSGNVGIGTSNPLTRLTVLNGNVGIGTWTSQTALDVEGIVSFDNRVRGNVGIGTVTPQGSFVVTRGNVGIGTWAPNNGIEVEGGNVGIGTRLNGALMTVGGSCAAHQGTGICFGASANGITCLGYCTAGAWPNCTTCNCC